MDSMTRELVEKLRRMAFFDIGGVGKTLAQASDAIEDLSEKNTMQNKDNIYGMISDRLEKKKSELKERQEQFTVMCENQMQSATFERNAIADLVVMQQLKSEIAELEHWETIMRAQMDM